MLHLTPAGAGLQGSVWVRPLGPEGPAYPPGVGGAHVMAQLDGRRVQARRDLAAERTAWAALLAACPRLAEASSQGRFELDEPASCLELLMELEDAEANLHWPAGVPFRVVRRLEWRDLRVRIDHERTNSSIPWPSIGGQRADPGVEGRGGELPPVQPVPSHRRNTGPQRATSMV